MRVLPLHKRLTYLLVAIPAALLLSGGEINPIVSLLFVAGVAVSWFWEPPRIDFEPWRRRWTAVTVLLFALTAFRLLSAGELVIAPIVDMVLVVTVIKLMQRATPRDTVQLMALSFLLMTAGSAYNQGLAFALAFAAYLFAGTLALAVKHLREELVEHHPSELPRFRVERGFLATIAGLALVVCAFSVALFLAFPRMGFGLFNRAGRSGVMTSGFSEEVTLGEHGTIRSDDTAVMRVRFPGRRSGPPHGELRWRGVSFDYYDGRRWSHSHVQRGGNARDPSGLYTRRGVDVDLDDAVVQDIYLEPIDADVLFGLPHMVGVRFPDEDPALLRSFWRESLAFTRSGQVLLHGTANVGRHYIAYSVESERALSSYEDGADRRYLQLPRILGERFYALAERTAGPPGGAMERASRIEAFLQDNYAYTTDLPEVSADNPLESFLFDTRRGHCEYFATAMVLLARATGLPARNVNGFLGGDWNGVGDYTVVRQSHAHSWVEVFSPEQGWVTFDPTPPSDLPAGSEGGFWTALAAFFDNIRMFWYQHIIDYSLEHQMGAAHAVISLFSDGVDLNASLYMFSRAFFRNAGVGLLLILLWLVGGLAYRRRRTRELPWGAPDRWLALALFGLSLGAVLLLWRPHASMAALIGAALGAGAVVLTSWLARLPAPRQRTMSTRRGRLTPASRAFLRLVRKLTRRGYVYGPSETPDALVAQARAARAPYVDRLDDTVRLYQACRFGGRPDGVGQLKRQIKALVAEM